MQMTGTPLGTLSLDGRRKAAPFLRNCFAISEKHILSPVCGSKTRSRIREDTILINYPLYCPKCRQERLIEVRNLQTIVITEPDAKTQSR